MPTTPSAVLLDVGGVFLLPSHAHIRSALSRIDHVVTDDAAIDRAHYVSVRVFPMDLESGEYMGPYWNDYLDAYARELGVDEPLLEEAIEHLRNEYVTGGLWSHLVEGSADGLRELVDSGVPVGIVSNSDGTVEAKLEEMGVLQVGPGHGVEVRCLVDSGHVGVEKPDPKIFDYAFEILDVPREDVWYVGDTPAFDIIGAQRAGLRPILMDPFGINADFGVTCVESLADVAELVGS